jgi:DnaJ-class molecular chaperone
MERYGDCPSCKGKGVIKKLICGRCEGTGCDGSADAWLAREEQIEARKRDFEQRREREEKQYEVQ